MLSHDKAPYPNTPRSYALAHHAMLYVVNQVLTTILRKMVLNTNPFTHRRDHFTKTQYEATRAAKMYRGIPIDHQGHEITPADLKTAITAKALM